MTKSQKSEYLKLADMLKPGYKPAEGETKLKTVQIRQKMKPLYVQIMKDNPEII